MQTKIINHPPEAWRAVSIGFAAASLIQEQESARIHSIFQRSLNCISAYGALVTIASKDLGNLPFGVLVDISPSVKLGSLRLKAGMPVQIKKSSLCLPDVGIRILLDDAKVWMPQKRLRKPLLSQSRIKSNLMCADELARKKGSTEGLGELLWYREDLLKNDCLRNFRGSNPLCQVAFKPLSSFIKGIKGKDHSQIMASAGRLLGLGVGLTPSADDLLVGIMGGLFFIGDHLGQKEYVSTIAQQISSLVEGKTTLISQTYLQYAARGEFHEWIGNMVSAILTSSESEVASATLAVLSMGSTSGTEIALGISLGLEMALESLRNAYNDGSL